MYFLDHTWGGGAGVRRRAHVPIEQAEALFRWITAGQTKHSATTLNQSSHFYDHLLALVQPALPFQLILDWNLLENRPSSLKGVLGFQWWVDLDPPQNISTLFTASGSMEKLHLIPFVPTGLTYQHWEKRSWAFNLGTTTTIILAFSRLQVPHHSIRQGFQTNISIHLQVCIMHHCSLNDPTIQTLSFSHSTHGFGHF